jgi:DNA invertase Pin-like site-specific DNA recombinase
MENQKPYSAVLYLRSCHTSIYAQALALHQYCEHNHIIILEAVFETEDDGSLNQPERSAMVRAIFSRSLKPDLLLFTSLEVFAEQTSDALHLQHILAMHGVAIKAILQPDGLLAALPET